MAHPDRRAVLALAAFGSVAPFSSLQAQTLSLSPVLTQADAQNGLRTALERATVMATNHLGRTDAFMGNPRVRVVLPRALEDAGQVLLAQGQRRLVGELVTAMNRAAEAAMPEAKPLLVDAVKAMSVDDAVKVLRGGDRAATRHLEQQTRSAITEQFAPIMKLNCERARVAQKYDNFVASAASMGLLGSARDAGLPQYVARKALDSLFLVIGEVETLIRADPAGTIGHATVTRVFRALKSSGSE